MLDWLYHLVDLRSPRETDELDRHNKETRKAYLTLARAMVEGWEEADQKVWLSRIADAEKKLEGEHDG